MVRLVSKTIRSEMFWLFLLILQLTSCDRFRQDPIELAGSALGTTYSIKFFGTIPNRSLSEFHSDIKSVIKAVDTSMSVFYDDSEVSIFNKSVSDNWFKVSPELFRVIQEAVTISNVSNGAFDITIGNLIDLWGFGKTIRPDRVPPANDIALALQSSHASHFQISVDSLSIRKSIPGLSLNLSAIAKGYAVDAVSGYLEQQGISRYLVEIGGEVRTKGLKKNNKPWLVAIERPEVDKRSIYKVLKLSDSSMATSGDYRNFYEIGGRRYSHTINPESGWPVENSIASVSVIHPSCMTADALATTFMVMGYEKGAEFAKKGNYAVLWILRTDEGIIEKVSEAFNTELIQ